MSQATNRPNAASSAAKSVAAQSPTNESGRAILFNWIVMVLGLGAIIGLASLLSDYL